MSDPAGSPSPVDAYHAGLLAAGERLPSLAVVEIGPPDPYHAAEFATRYPARHLRLSAGDPVGPTLERSDGGGPVFLGGPLPWLIESFFPPIARTLLVPRRNVKVVGFPSRQTGPGAASAPIVPDDLALMRGIPALLVVAPADGPTVRSAVEAVADRAGSAYLRLPEPSAPAVTRGEFAIGRARELRSGTDLAILALGPLVGPALTVADELRGVGISVRVLDLASVKPLDEAAILRAARETGAILVAEAAPTPGGLGTLVAALTAENRPVPVRRFGLPDLPAPPAGAEGLEAAGLTLERLRDETLELLRLRGKIT